MNRSVFEITAILVIGTCLPVVLLCTGGCEQPPLEGETYRKVAVAWPLFDFEIVEGQTADGLTWRKEKGDACAWLASWDKEKRYDEHGFLVYRKEKSAFFPFYYDQIEESKTFREHKGAILIFPFVSRTNKAGPHLAPRSGSDTSP